MLYCRKNSRAYDEVRSIAFQKNPFGYAESSVLYEQEKTKLYVCVGLQMGVPKFLKGSGQGWLTAEYVMHPYSGEKTRKARDILPNGRDQRSVEISRLLGRVFRSVVDLSRMGERTLFVDCDVLQADGGTRTAAVNAISLAIMEAEKIWLSSKQIKNAFLKDFVIGVSCGIVNGVPLLDLDKDEDVLCEADFNFIMTKQKMLIEVQGTAEKKPISWNAFDSCRLIAEQGVSAIAMKLGL